MRIFLNLGIVEHTGHGIPMIVEEYGKEAFDIHQTSIDVTLPFNQSVLASVPQRGTDHGTDGGDIRLQEDVSDTEKRVILALIKNPENTYNQLASEMGVSRRSVSRAVASLVEKNILNESAITSVDSGKLFVDQFGVVDWSAGKGFSLYIKQLFTIFRPICQELMPERERRCPKR